MARITVEDCLKTIPNRFELVLAATYRARQLVQGHSPRVESRDKATVVAQSTFVIQGFRCGAPLRRPKHIGIQRSGLA
ncbi:MAG: hypothetical protein RL551_1089 [Pseudomonadota bacterium]